jgi:rod shape-determining protein MreD
MISARDRVLRDPARSRLILGSLLLAYIVALLPWNGLVLKLQPDWVLLVLIHWWLREPWRLGQGAAFVAGVLMDIAQTGTLGVHALAYSLAAWLTLRLRARLLGFAPAAQAPQILPMLVLARLSATAGAIAAGGSLPAWTFFASCLIDMVFWIPITLLLHYRDLERSHRDS